MTPLEAALHLGRAIAVIDYQHSEGFGTRIDTGERFPWCRTCDTSWPCDPAKIKQAAEALPQIVAALEVLEEIAESGHIPEEDLPDSFSNMARRALRGETDG